MPYFVYMLTNFKKNVLYIGLTGNLAERVAQHKSGQVEGFTRKYNVNSLIYFEQFDDITEAKARERNLKKWKRDWKEKLVNQSNPEWNEILIV
ncbi:MAG: GIY-YIG nuclease family protein [Alphaproteobacteria bacterium]